MNRSARAAEALAHTTRRLRRSTARRIGLQPNPLRRPSDRLEAYARLVALLLWVAAFPLAVATGRAVHGAMDAAAAGSSAWPAVVLSDASEPSDPAGRDAWQPRTAKVGWTTADGVEHTTVTQIPADAHRGAHFTLWTGADGRPTMPPPAAVIRWTEAVVAAAGVMLGVLALLALVLLVLRRVLDRRRYRAWDLEWLEDGASRPRRGDGLR